MTVTSITALNNASASTSASATTGTAGGMGSLGQEEFLLMMTEQLKQQDPFNPVDNSEMLAQMAQFSSLATMTDVHSTLEVISGKLDLLAAAAATSQE